MDTTPTPGTPAPPPLPATPSHRKRTITLLTAGALLIALIAGTLGYLIGHNTTPSQPTAHATPTPKPSSRITPLTTPTPKNTPTPTATTTNTPTSAPTEAPTATSIPCGPFDTTLPDLMDGTGPAIPGSEASGCGPGTVPTSGTPFLAPAAGWTIVASYTCSGDPGDMGSPIIDFIAHNTDTSADMAADEQPGPWGQTESGVMTLSGADAPAGSYIITVSLVHPDINQCQWHVVAHRGIH